MDASLKRSYFLRSVEAIMRNWTALQMLVAHQAAGQNSQAIADWLITSTTQWVDENNGLEAYEVSEFLEDTVAREFNAEIEDGSCMQVASTVCKFYTLCQNSSSEDEVLSHLKQLPKCDLSKCKVVGENADNDDVDESEDAGSGVSGVENGIKTLSTDNSAEASTGSNKPEPDEDGWITVPSRKK